jgi:pentapeptide MXKDX repeat protein
MRGDGGRPHVDAMDRDAMDRDAMDRDAMDRDAMDRDAVAATGGGVGRTGLEPVTDGL